MSELMWNVTDSLNGQVVQTARDMIITNCSV